MAFDGKLIVFSAPSGSGKTTIVRHLLANNSNLGFSISACTRDKRGRNEVHGKDYYFLSPEEFKAKIDKEAARQEMILLQEQLQASRLAAEEHKATLAQLEADYGRMSAEWRAKTEGQ